MDEVLEAAALGFRFVLAFVFLNAGVSKLLAPGQFARAVRNYRLLPERLNESVATWLPRLELALALALLFGIGAAIVAGVAGALVVAFAGAVSVNLARGRRIDCGCATAPSPRTIGWGLVARNLALAAMAGAVVIADPGLLAVVAIRAQEVASLTAGEAVAIAMLAAVAVVTYLLVSSWLNLCSATRAFLGQQAGAR